MRATLVLLACIELAACQKPMISGCETYIKDGLKSPSSYKRADITEIDVPITEEDYNKATGPALAKIRKQFQLPTPTKVHAILIHYDADNSYGTPIRDLAECVFETADTGRFANVTTRISYAEAERDQRLRISSGQAPNDGTTDMDPAYPCCLP